MEVAHLYFLLWCAQHVPDVAIATAVTAPRSTTRNLPAAAADRASRTSSRLPRARQETAPAHMRGNHTLPPSTSKVSVPHLQAQRNCAKQVCKKPAVTKNRRRKNCSSDAPKRCERPPPPRGDMTMLLFLVGYALGILTTVVLLRLKEAPN